MSKPMIYQVKCKENSFIKVTNSNGFTKCRKYATVFLKGQRVDSCTIQIVLEWYSQDLDQLLSAFLIALSTSAHFVEHH